MRRGRTREIAKDRGPVPWHEREKVCVLKRLRPMQRACDYGQDRGMAGGYQPMRGHGVPPISQHTHATKSGRAAKTAGLMQKAVMEVLTKSRQVLRRTGHGTAMFVLRRHEPWPSRVPIEAAGPCTHAADSLGGIASWPSSTFLISWVKDCMWES
jgi:hypothetical protein